MAGGPSIYYVGLHVEIVPYHKLQNGQAFNLVWNPALEARPRHINEKFGDNMDMQTVVVEYPSGLPDHVRAAQEATRRKDQMTDEQGTAQQSSPRFTSGSLHSGEFALSRACGSGLPRGSQSS